MKLKLLSLVFMVFFVWGCQHGYHHRCKYHHSTKEKKCNHSKAYEASTESSDTKEKKDQKTTETENSKTEKK